MSEDVHARGVEPDEERLCRLVLAVDEVQRRLQELLVDDFGPKGLEPSLC
jgi:hypothetical protein